MKMHKIGAIFDATSKRGTSYRSLKLFQSTDHESNIRIFAFPKKSKAGKDYWEVSMEVNEGEAPEAALDRFIGEVTRHKSVADKEWNNWETKY